MTPGTFYLDDIAVDSDAANLTVPSGNPDDCQYTGSGNYPVLDPIKGHPRQSGFGLTLQPYTQIPAARPTSPTARINYLGQVPDHSGRMFVPDLYGSLYLLQDGVPHKYLDVASAFPDFVSSPGLGTGFGFVAFAPDFQRTGKFYTVHTEAGAALSRKDPGELPAPEQVAVEGVVTEWTADDPSADTFHGTHREVLRIGFHTFVHGLQQIAFNPTARPGDPDYGLLYIGVGDGMEQPDFTHIAQNLGMPHGKLLRIDPNGTDGIGGGYGIPKSNPFVGQAGVLGSIYVYGLRNPHRFSWDRARPHRMILTNIGESSIESIYIVHPGDNYGWNEREGQFLYKPSDPRNVYPLPEDDSKYGYTYPVASLDHDEIRSIVGGFVYRGKALPELRGKYIFGDIVSGKIWYTEASEMQRGGPQTPVYQFNLFELYPGNTVTMQQLAGSSRVDLRLGEDANGEIYVLSKANGKIWKVTGAHQVGACKVEGQRLTDVMGRENWRPLNPDLWQFPGDAAILTQPGSQPPGPRRPYEYAVLTAGLPYASVQIDAQVRIDTPVSVTNRDVVLLFGFQSDTRFYYAHLGSDNSIYPHNGIFVVNDADRKRIDDQWNGTFGAPPAISDTNYHDVRIRFCAPTGEIAVYVDNMLNPLMTATDHTLHSGRLGFGSFDNYGRIRDVSIIGRPAKS